MRTFAFLQTGAEKNLCGDDSATNWGSQVKSEAGLSSVVGIEKDEVAATG